MRKAASMILPIAQIAWRWLREWSGDAAYELYLRSAATKSASHRPLDQAAFYVEQLERKYSRPSRCC